MNSEAKRNICKGVIDVVKYGGLGYAVLGGYELGEKIAPSLQQYVGEYADWAPIATTWGVGLGAAAGLAVLSAISKDYIDRKL